MQELQGHRRNASHAHVLRTSLLTFTCLVSRQTFASCVKRVSKWTRCASVYLHAVPH